MDIQQALFHLLGIALAEGFKRIGPAVQLAALERNIDFRATVARDESRVFETQQIREEPPSDINIVPDLLGADAHAGRGAQFFQAAEPGFFAREKYVVEDAHRRAQVISLSMSYCTPTASR